MPKKPRKAKDPAARAGANRVKKTVVPTKGLVPANDNSVGDENPAVAMLMRRYGYERWRAHLLAHLSGFGRDT